MQVAAELGDRQLEGLATMSLAASLSYDGHFADSITTVDRAIALLHGDHRVVALSQRAGLLQRAGRNGDALLAFSHALSEASNVDDPSLRGDLWLNRGVLLAVMGDVASAEADTRAALGVFVAEGWEKRAVDMRHNLAWLAGRRGDVVDALRRFDEAEADYDALGMTAASIFPDRCEVLISAGLADEALMLAEASAANFDASGNRVDAAESLLLVAKAALLTGDFDRAASASADAAEAFGAQGRTGWDAAARLLTLEARLADGEATLADRDAAIEVAGRLGDAAMPGQRAGAMLVAAEIALSHGENQLCAADVAALESGQLGFAERFRLDLVLARLDVANGAPAAALDRCVEATRGFAEISAALGGTEIRAHIAAHVERLVDLGTSLALAGGDPRQVVAWAERQRSSVLTAAPVLPPEDDELQREFNLLRAAMTDLDDVSRQGGDDTEARQRFDDAQDRVQRRSRHLEIDDPTADVDVAAAASVVVESTRTCVVFVEAANELHSVRVDGGDVVAAPVASLADVARQVELLQSMYAMHLTALGRGRERDPSAIVQAAAELDALLFPGGAFADDHPVICPTGAVFDLPWGLLPSLRETAFTLAPSIRSATAVASATDHDRAANAAVVAGPALEFADAEARSIAALHGSERLLLGSDADADSVKAAMQDATLVHLVCHGRFVTGNAMFSSLRLHDGELFVYELERLRPAPHTVVLSACNAGLHGSPATGQVLGITTSLLAAGTRSVVAATVPIPDTVSTVELMTTLHTGLRDGDSPAESLRVVRAASPVIGAAFSCHGPS